PPPRRRLPRRHQTISKDSQQPDHAFEPRRRRKKIGTSQKRARLPRDATTERDSGGNPPRRRPATRSRDATTERDSGGNPPQRRPATRWPRPRASSGGPPRRSTAPAAPPR